GKTSCHRVLVNHLRWVNESLVRHRHGGAPLERCMHVLQVKQRVVVSRHSPTTSNLVKPSERVMGANPLDIDERFERRREAIFDLDSVAHVPTNALNCRARLDEALIAPLKYVTEDQCVVVLNQSVLRTTMTERDRP